MVARLEMVLLLKWEGIVGSWREESVQGEH